MLKVQPQKLQVTSVRPCCVSSEPGSSISIVCEMRLAEALPQLPSFYSAPAPPPPKLGFSPPLKLPSNHRTGRGNAFTHLRITSTTTRAPTLERLWELKGLGYPQRTLNWDASRDHLLSHILVQLPVSCASSPTSPLSGYKYFPKQSHRI